MVFVYVSALIFFLPWHTIDTEGTASRRSDDPGPWEAVITQQDQIISEMKAQMAATEAKMAAMEARLAKQEKEIAFSAYLSTQQDLTDGDTIIFDGMDMNMGNGYDKLTGMFSAPVSGLYLFSVKITHVPPGILHVHLRKQGVSIAEVEARGDEHDRSSATVTTHLAAGQRVWVQKVDGTASRVTVCQRVRRADDSNPLEATVMQQSQTIARLEAELASVKARLDKEETKVAFNVRFSALHTQPLTESDFLIFDAVDLNQGGGYDKITGIFTAPVTGLYLFSLKIGHAPPGKLHVLMLRDDDNHTIAEVEANGDNTDYTDRSATVVAVQLNKGQRVYNKRFAQGSTSETIQGAWRSSFTGVLIRADA